jgi:hypothetical protein
LFSVKCDENETRREEKPMSSLCGTKMGLSMVRSSVLFSSRGSTGTGWEESNFIKYCRVEQCQRRFTVALDAAVMIYSTGINTDPELNENFFFHFSRQVAKLCGLFGNFSNFGFSKTVVFVQICFFRRLQ